jgi:hypothetical protein
LLSKSKQWGGEGLCSQRPHLSHLSSLRYARQAPVLLPQAGEDGNLSFSEVSKVTKAMGVEIEAGGGLNTIF